MIFVDLWQIYQWPNDKYCQCLCTHPFLTYTVNWHHRLLQHFNKNKCNCFKWPMGDEWRVSERDQSLVTN
jgi:hypothetical protein